MLFTTSNLCSQSRLHSFSASLLLSPYYQEMLSSTVYHDVESFDTGWAKVWDVDFCYINVDGEEGFYANVNSSIVHYFCRGNSASGYSRPKDYLWKHYAIEDKIREDLSDLFTLAVETSSPQSKNDWIDASHHLFLHGIDIAEGWNTSDRPETQELIRLCNMVLQSLRTDNLNLLPGIQERLSFLLKHYRSIIDRSIWHYGNYVGIGSNSSYLQVVFETKERNEDNRTFETERTIERTYEEKVLSEVTAYLLERMTGPLYLTVLIVPDNLIIDNSEKGLYDVCIYESDFSTKTIIELYESQSSSLTSQTHINSVQH